MSSAVTDHLVVTPSDHGAFIVIAGLIGLIWTVLVLAMRLYIRFGVNGPFGLDDAATSFATLVGIVQTSLTLIAVHHGMGKGQDLLTHEDLDLAMKASSWLDLSRGERTFVRVAIVESFSLLIEALISGMAVMLVWNLSMALKTKILVVAAFSAQLLVIIPVSFRLLFVREVTVSDDVTFDFTNPAIATQVVMHFSIMAATFPCFRQFLQAFDSGLGATIGSDLGTGSHANSGYILQSFDSAHSGKMKRGKRPQETRKQQEPAKRVESSTGIEPGSDENKSVESDGSDKAIIWRTQGWEVRYDLRDSVGRQQREG
ncbi:hypothetical protein DCS_05782 [Drechmeria coniospora]|uniref:Rhodopsin domain-containing protein n=1 Tax=Drechmeria coniospora TaxID=98403 RepID=A0A151GNS2_DRECN|nr:hypothetical protein DCS_05782 [Drechmeria coniospora]KYK58764.1 hypothetical protein DCS_05782 [Drechmeria coniospora]